MKIAGKVYSGPNVVTLVLPRGDESVVIKAQAVLDLEEVESYMSLPTPPSALGKGGVKVQNFEDKNYKEALEIYNQRKMDWMVVKSLEPSEIEWETIDIEKPGSWGNYKEEFKKAGFSTVEVGRIVNAVLEANCLDENKLEQARKVFLLGQAAALEASTGPSTEQPTS